MYYVCTFIFFGYGPQSMKQAWQKRNHENTFDFSQHVAHIDGKHTRD